MSAPEVIFPRRITRRDLLKQAGATATAAMLLGSADSGQAAERAKVRIGSGHWTYTLDENWGRLPEGMHYGLGCAIVVDAQDRIYVTSRSASPCLAVFTPEGELLETWSNDFAANIDMTADQVASTAHGLYWSKEGDAEYFYFTENKPSRRVIKTDLEGRVLYKLGPDLEATSTSAPFDFVNPTDVAVAANGDIYVVDGYGSQLVHLFDKNFQLKKTIGGRGKEHGKFQVCHGVWISTLGDEPEVYIADRANNRLEVYSLDLEYRRSVPDVRLPCCFYQHDGHLYVPELGARVSILDAQDRAVARLGDGEGIPKEEIDNHPDKFATPHALTVDSRGNIYILEWLPHGRVRKFAHTPA